MKKLTTLLLILGACKTQHTANSVQQATLTPLGEAGTLEHPPIEPPPSPRATRRLTVDQLAASLPIVCGNDEKGQPITWTVKSGANQLPALAEGGLGAILGKPDFVLATDEPDDASALYVKLMEDMARDVCGKMVTADLARTDRVLAKFAPIDTVGDGKAIDQNLRYLSLRFLSHKVADEDVEGIAGLRKIYDSVVSSTAKAGEKSREGWRAVCVGLLTSPEFHVN